MLLESINNTTTLLSKDHRLDLRVLNTITSQFHCDCLYLFFRNTELVGISIIQF